MAYTEDDLMDFIARHDEHEAYYRGKLAKIRTDHDRQVAAKALQEAADHIELQHAEIGLTVGSVITGLRAQLSVPVTPGGENNG